MKDDERDLGELPSNARSSLIQTLDFLRDPVAADAVCMAEFGEVWGSKVLNRPTVATASANLASELLLDRKRRYSSQGGWGHYLGGLFDGGLMLRDFEDHQRHRRIMQVAFRESARRTYHVQLQAETTRSLDTWASAEGQTFAFYPAVKQALLEQAAVVFLGMPLAGAAKRLTQHFLTMLDASIAALRWNVPFMKYGRGLRARRELVELLIAELPARRGAEGHDVFSVLANARSEEGEAFTDDEVVDHMIFVLLAAHDTTTTAMCTLVEHLALAPEWQERLRRECGAAGPVSYEALADRTETDWAFREALRLNPPVPYIVRRTTEACPFAGHDLKARVPLSLVLRGPHRDPQLWSAPARFDPERFSPERGEDRSHPHAWIPFGGGAHRCIGAEFARQQSKVFLHHLLTRYRFNCPSGREPNWQIIPLPRPRDGLPLELTALHPSTV